jgi:hypothetical protein
VIGLQISPCFTKADIKKAVESLSGVLVYPGNLSYPGGSKLYDVQTVAYSDAETISTEETTGDASDSGNGKYPDAVYLHKSSTPYYVYPEGGILW